MNVYCRIITVVLLVLSFAAFSQEDVYRSIVTQKDDVKKAERLIQFGMEIGEQDPQLALQALDAAVAVNRKLGFNHGIGVALLNLCILKNSHGQREEAKLCLYEAVEYFKRDSNHYQIGNAYILLAEIFAKDGKLDSVMHNNLLAISHLERIPHKKKLFYAYYGVAGVLETLEYITRSEEYYDKALHLARKLNDTTLLVEALTAVCKYRLNRKQYNPSAQAADEALGLVQGAGNDYLKAVVFNTKAVLYLTLKNADSSIYYAQQSYAYSSALQGTFNRLEALTRLADAFDLKGDKEKSYFYLREALPIAERFKHLPYQANIYERLSTVQAKRGYYKEAYQYEKKFGAFRDSLLNEETSRISADLEARYEASLKEKTIAEKQLQITRNRLYLYGILAALAVSLLIGVFLYVQARSRQKYHARQLQSLRREKELLALQALMQGEEKARSQIAKDLHDGVAGMLAAAKMHLNSLLARYPVLAEEEESRQAVHLLDESSAEVRKTSHNLMPEVLTQYGLDEAVRRYCGNIHNSRTLVVQYDSWGEIDRFIDGFELSVYRIVQELLNNIVKHSRATEAIVQMSQQDNTLSLTIEDNGMGFDHKGKRDGMGLRSLQARVKAMNGRMELQAESGSGVSAYLEFDVTGLQKEVYECY